MDGGLLLDPVQEGSKYDFQFLWREVRRSVRRRPLARRRPARRCGTRDRARAHHLPFTRTRAAQRRTSEMITRLGTKVGETDDVAAGTAGVSGPAARKNPTSGGGGPRYAHERWCVHFGARFVRLPVRAFGRARLGLLFPSPSRPRPLRLAVLVFHRRRRGHGGGVTALAGCCDRGSSTPPPPPTQPW